MDNKKTEPAQHQGTYFHQMLTAPTYAGANTIALNIAAALRDRGRLSHVWIPGEGAATAKADEFGLTWHRYDPSRALGSSRLESMLCNWVVGRQLHPYRPGLIHVQSPHFYRVLMPALTMSRLRTLVHVQIEESEASLRWSFRNPPQVIIACARFLIDHIRNALPERFRSSQSIICLPNAVDTNRFHCGDKDLAKQRVGATSNWPLILLVANLAPHKGQETGIRAVAILKDRGVNVQLWLTGSERGGSSEYTERLKALRTSLGVADRVQLLGERRDVPELLRAATCAILPSTAEGLPLSILEAQASKVPLVAAPTAGIPEIIADGETGFLVRADDADGYADRMALLCQNVALAHEMSERAYHQILREYTWKTFVERMLDIYASVLNR